MQQLFIIIDKMQQSKALFIPEAELYYIIIKTQ